MTQKEEYRMNKLAAAYEIIDEIEELSETCCAITLDPDEIVEHCKKLRNILESIIKEEKL